MCPMFNLLICFHLFLIPRAAPLAPVFVRLLSLLARFGRQSACLVRAVSSAPRLPSLLRALCFFLNIIRIILIKNARVSAFCSFFPPFPPFRVHLLFRAVRPVFPPVRPWAGFFGRFCLTCVNFGCFFAFFIKFSPVFLGGFAESVYLCTRFSAKRSAAGREGFEIAIFEEIYIRDRE